MSFGQAPHNFSLHKLAINGVFVAALAVFLTVKAHSAPIYKLGYYAGKVEALLKDADGNATFAVLEQNATIRASDGFFTGKRSIAEFHGPKSSTIRMGSEVTAELEGPHTVYLAAGTILVCLPKETRFSVRSNVASASYEGRGTFFIECTGNGGFKIIHLEGKGTYFTEKGGMLKLRGGQLCFVIRNPSEFGEVYDIDILLLVRTSRLLNAFPELPPTIGRIGLSLYTQDLLMKSKYNALIGDAPTDKNIQLWTLEKSEGKESKRETGTPKKRGFFRRIFGNKDK